MSMPLGSAAERQDVIANFDTDEKKRKPLEHLLAYQRPDASSTHKQHEDDDIISSMRMIMHAYASLALLLAT